MTPSPAWKQLFYLSSIMIKNRAGSVCLNSFRGAVKWIPASVTPLIAWALKHVDNMRTGATMMNGPISELPVPVELIGRAYVTTDAFDLPYVSADGTVSFQHVSVGGARKTPPYPEMRWGYPVPARANITTGKLPALLLYESGACTLARRFHSHEIAYLEYSSPLPVAGAQENLGLKPTPGPGAKPIRI